MGPYLSKGRADWAEASTVIVKHYQTELVGYCPYSQSYYCLQFSAKTEYGKFRMCNHIDEILKGLPNQFTARSPVTLIQHCDESHERVIVALQKMDIYRQTEMDR